MSKMVRCCVACDRNESYHSEYFWVSCTVQSITKIWCLWRILSIVQWYEFNKPRLYWSNTAISGIDFETIENLFIKIFRMHWLWVLYFLIYHQYSSEFLLTSLDVGLRNWLECNCFHFPIIDLLNLDYRLFHIIGWLSLAFVQSGKFSKWLFCYYTIYCGFILGRDSLLYVHTLFMSLAGIIVQLTGYTSSHYFPKSRALIMTIFTGASCSSSIWYSVFQVKVYFLWINFVLFG